MLILYWCLVALMVIGIVGAVVPAIPGISLIAIAAFVWMLATGLNSGVIAFAVAIVVLGLGILVDFLAGYWGAKQAGASQWGQIGAVVGMVVGILGLLPTVPFGGPLSPVLGIIIGSVVGAAIGEFLYRRDAVAAGKAALGIVVGTLIGNLIQAILALATTIVFLVTTWPYK